MPKAAPTPQPTVSLDTPPKEMLIFLKKWVKSHDVHSLEIFDKEDAKANYVSNIEFYNIKWPLSAKEVQND